MDDMQTMIRTQVAVNGSSFSLAQGQDVEALKRRVEEAAQAGGRFVTFVVVGNRSVSVLVSQGTDVVLSVETVQFDPRDNGDDQMPYGGLYDF